VTPDWNAEVYHRVSEPQWNWGLAVLSSLTLEGNETVIDAGCGTGRLTNVLMERLTSGRGIALDSSEAMLEVARRELARFDGRIAFLNADLGALDLHNLADVVFSTATFHWVKDHAALATGLYRALKPGGRVHAQCGGHGNLAAFLKLANEVSAQSPFAAHFEGFVYPAHFATPEATKVHFEAAGFANVECWLTDAPTPFETRDDFSTFVSAVVLRTMLARLPDALQPAYLEQVIDRAPQPYTLDYVRLELRAEK